MEGYILRIIKSIKEDVIVKILTLKNYHTLYRFYGARHSILFTGRKIDFEIEYQGVHIPKLRNLTHLAREYERDIEKVFIWQQFCGLLDKHLDGTKGVDRFYFQALDAKSRILSKMDAKRLVIHLYMDMLEFEGRLYSEDFCFICGARLDSKIAVTNGFLLACPQCIINPTIMDKRRVLESFETHSLINMDDKECSMLYNVVLLGL